MTQTPFPLTDDDWALINQLSLDDDMDIDDTQLASAMRLVAMGLAMTGPGRGSEDVVGRLTRAGNWAKKWGVIWRKS